MSDEEIKSGYRWIKRSYHFSNEILEKRASKKESRFLLETAPKLAQSQKSKIRI